MRLSGQERCGYFPTPPEVGPELLKHLSLGQRTEKASEHQILDPCCGEAEILKQIADGLHIPYGTVYGVEIDKGRGEKARQVLPGANMLAPCDLFSTLISPRSFSLLFTNPPFDSAEIGRGNGREETRFAKEAYGLLVDNGVLVMVAPLRTYRGQEFREFLETHFRDIGLYRFPTPIYSEVVMIARKRSSALDQEEASKRGVLTVNYGLRTLHGRAFDYRMNRYRGVGDLNELPALGTIACDWVDGCPGEPHDLIKIWDIPPSWRPSRFAKGDYLEDELIEAILASDNNKLFRAESEPDIAEAPLPLAEGHVALLVASGALDGLIEVPGRPELAHVMRGISRKVEQPNEEASKAVLSEDGRSMRVTEVYSETMDTRIRCVDRSFTIFTFGLEPAKSAKTREFDVKIEQASTDIGASDSVEIALIREGNSDFVSIDCGFRRIKFVFDTGAEICQVNSSDVKGVDHFVTGRTFSLVGAAGLAVPAKEILICSMMIGTLTAKNVRCAVVEPILGDVPNLLGQNFLRMFDYTYSQKSSILTLRLATAGGEQNEQQTAA